MIAINERTGTIGRVVSATKQEVTIEPASAFELTQFGTWRFADQHEVYPRRSVRCFETQSAAERAYRAMLDRIR